MMNVMHSHNTIRSVLCNLSGTRFLHFVNRKRKNEETILFFYLYLGEREHIAVQCKFRLKFRLLNEHILNDEYLEKMRTASHAHTEKMQHADFLSAATATAFVFLFFGISFPLVDQRQSNSNTNDPLQILAHFILVYSICFHRYCLCVFLLFFFFALYLALNNFTNYGIIKRSNIAF